MILRLLNAQGIAGLAAALCLGALLLIQKGETRRWRDESRQFAQLYRAEQVAFARTVSNYRAAAEAVRAADRAAAERVRSEQAAINERTRDEFEARLAAARARAERLRIEASRSATDPRTGRAAPVPGLPAAPGGTAQASHQDRLPDPDRLIATEQAIQLDELIKWVRRQSAVSADR